MSLEESFLERTDYLIAKGQKILERNADRRARKNVKTPEIDKDEGAFVEWQYQSIGFLVNALGRDHVYTRGFAHKAITKLDTSIQSGLGILRAVREDIEGGYLSDLRTLISAEVFTDFLDMAEHLHKSGYVHPAASLAGAVLEDGMRKIAAANNINLKAREDLSSLNQKLANATVYNRLMQQKLQPWI
jgi:hypothetical protein